MKCQGDNLIIHSLFVDDIMHMPTCDALKKEFMDRYTRILHHKGLSHGYIFGYSG
jgi:hypothetical protein